MILTSGGRFAGYGFYLLRASRCSVEHGRLERIKWEGPDALSPGRHTVEFDFKYDGIGVATLEYNNFSGLASPAPAYSRSTARRSPPADGEDAAMILQWDESFDIGSDTLTGVNDADYKPPFL